MCNCPKKPCGCVDKPNIPKEHPCDCLGTTPVTELVKCGVQKCDTGCEDFYDSDCVVVKSPTYSFVLTEELIEMNKLINKLKLDIELIKATCCNNCSMVMSNIIVV